MNSLAFEKFESLDADCLVQFQGEGWVGAVAGGVAGFIGGAALGAEAAAPLALIPGFGWVTDVGCSTVGAISGAIGGAASGYKASAW
ncbi:hypothetical protein LGW13_06940 [Streptococcus mutans]|nr:hypothetical protein [Streptococcus mutans]